MCYADVVMVISIHTKQKGRSNESGLSVYGQFS